MWGAWMRRVGCALGPVLHKVVHGVAGAAVGAMLSLGGGTVGANAAAGAVGAAVAETVAEGASLGLCLNPDTAASLGQLAAQTLTIPLNLNSTLTQTTAANAINNNFLHAPLVWGAIGAAGAAVSAYEVYEAYESGGPEAALKTAGVHAATAVVGGVVVRTGFKVGGVVYAQADVAWKAFLKANPHLAPLAQSAKSIRSAASQAKITPQSTTVVAPAPKGAHHPATKAALGRGKKAHKEFEAVIEKKQQTQNLWKGGGEKREVLTSSDGLRGIPDAITPRGRPVELKPLTPSGLRLGIPQLRRYEQITRKKGILGFYDETGQRHYLRSNQVKSVQQIKELLKNRVKETP